MTIWSVFQNLVSWMPLGFVLQIKSLVLTFAILSFRLHYHLLLRIRNPFLLPAFIDQLAIIIILILGFLD